MQITNPEIEQYCQNHSSPENKLLSQLNRQTHANVLQPRMLSGHLQGRLLAMLSQMLQPKNILEIGTYTGYSALCLAEGLAAGGKILTIDVNEELGDFVRGFFEQSPYKNQIDFRIGDAKAIIPTLTETFDLVFIDADKRNYPAYYDLVFEKVRTGGIILIDNVLWDGKVADASKKDKDTVLIREFNQKIHEDPRTEHVLLPIRDGLTCIRKVF